MKVSAYEGIVENGCVRLPIEVVLPERTKVYVVVPEIAPPRTTHIRSPRLSDSSQAKDFIKEVLPDNGDTDL